MNANAVEWWGVLDEFGFTVMRALLCVLWQSSIVFAGMGLLVWVRRGRRATVRHALWLAALLVAPVLPLLTSLGARGGAPQAPVSGLPAYVVVEKYVEAPPEAPMVPLAAAPTAIEAEPVQGEQPQPSVLEYPWALLLVAYVVGVVFFLAWTALGRIRLRQWVVGAVPVLDERVRSAFAEAKEELGLRREFLVLESDQVPAPLTAGFLRPVVLLPKGLSDRLTDAELRAVALHEAAHVRRRDPLVLSLIPLVRAALFFHPLVWLACRQVSLLAEQAADDAVLDATGEPLAYAKMLARLAEGLRRRSLPPNWLRASSSPREPSSAGSKPSSPTAETRSADSPAGPWPAPSSPPSSPSPSPLHSLWVKGRPLLQKLTRMSTLRRFSRQSGRGRRV